MGSGRGAWPQCGGRGLRVWGRGLGAGGRGLGRVGFCSGCWALGAALGGLWGMLLGGSGVWGLPLGGSGSWRLLQGGSGSCSWGALGSGGFPWGALGAASGGLWGLGAAPGGLWGPGVGGRQGFVPSRLPAEPPRSAPIIESGRNPPQNAPGGGNAGCCGHRQGLRHSCPEWQRLSPALPAWFWGLGGFVMRGKGE